MYRYSTSTLTIRGFVGGTFTLSKSVCQGCAFDEAMSLFLRRHIPQVWGLHLPLSMEQELLDFAYVDETSLYTLSAKDGLYNFGSIILASEEKIN